MLTITICTDRETVTHYARKCGRVFSQALYLYLAQNGDEVLAAALFEVGSAQVSVVYYEATEETDCYLFDGILRAGLNYASSQGIENGYISEEFRHQYRALFQKLNYPIQSLFNITNFFQKYKNCAGR